MTNELTTRDVFQQLDARLGRVEDDLRAFRTEVSGRFDRMYGMLLVSWLTLMASIWLKP